MRAGDLTPGEYYAHGSTYVNCIIHTVTYSAERQEVWVDHTYQGERMNRWYDEDRDWKVKRHSIVIEEPVDWADLLIADRA